MSEKVYLYPVWVRVWHWINAFMFLVLIITGLSMQYSSPNYPMIRFDFAVTIHNIAGIIVVIDYIFYVIANRVTPNGKYYKLRRKGLLKRLTKQFMYYTFGIFKKQQAPYPISRSRKFNPLQKVSYIVAMYLLLPLLILTGFGLLYPEIILSKVFGVSGIHLTDLIHILMGFMLSVFMIIHIYFCTMGKTPFSNFKSMMDGWH